MTLLGPVKDVDEVVDVYKGLLDIQEFYVGIGDIMTDEQLKILEEKISSLRGSIV